MRRSISQSTDENIEINGDNLNPEILSPEALLIKSYELLTSNNIEPWLCHGTLLGIIRENRIIPWDHDIDLAVWESKVSKDTVRQIFTSAGYIEERIFGEMNCLHFTVPNSHLKVDISFYVVEDNLASIKWICPTDNYIRKFFLYIIMSIFQTNDAQTYPNYFSMKFVFSLILYYLAYPIRSLIKHQDKLLDFLLKYVHEYRGYSYDEVMLRECQSFNLHGHLLNIPVDANRCLRETYGESWQEPKADYTWHKEADNLYNMKY